MVLSMVDKKKRPGKPLIADKIDDMTPNNTSKVPMVMSDIPFFLSLFV